MKPFHRPSLRLLPKNPYNMFFAGGFTNRLSWLRDDSSYINECLHSPEARFVLLANLRPLVDKSTPDYKLKTATWEQVASVYGHSSFKDPTASLVYDSNANPATATTTTTTTTTSRNSLIVFLGLEGTSTLDNPQKPTGHPYFGLEVHKEHEEILKKLVAGNNGEEKVEGEKESELEYEDLRASAVRMHQDDVGVVGTARALIEWNRRTKFCPGCGNELHTMFGGWKKGIPPNDPKLQNLLSTLSTSTTNVEKPFCISREGKHNFQYPRNDPVVIMAVMHPKEDSLLLGNNKAFPSTFYSCLAGFVEPGESIEDAVMREVWEEAGVRVSQVKYHSSQPWPFPGSLMIGAYAVAAEDFEIRTDIDNELKDARFFSRKELQEALADPTRSTLSRQEISQLDQKESLQKRVGEEDFKIRLPPRSAIAHILIDSWIKGEF